MEKENCVYCKINKGEIKSYTIYEDSLTRAILDINPVSPGHILAISKEHYENIFEAPDEILARINIVCKNLALVCKKKLKCKGVNIINSSGKTAQQGVFHLHYHVIPRFENDGNDLLRAFFPKEKGKINLEEIYKKIKK
jgi:diadenosine tetraphosphate (Ap4A) HIT family hydrolase